jgi:hypothetical protein
MAVISEEQHTSRKTSGSYPPRDASQGWEQGRSLEGRHVSVERESDWRRTPEFRDCMGKITAVLKSPGQEASVEWLRKRGAAGGWCEDVLVPGMVSGRREGALACTSKIPMEPPNSPSLPNIRHRNERVSLTRLRRQDLLPGRRMESDELRHADIPRQERRPGGRQGLPEQGRRAHNRGHGDGTKRCCAIVKR